MRVFVSSTYEDLKEHRRAVDDILARMLEHFVGMEYFGARPTEPTEVCLTEIANSTAFVGIYAHRYGWVPPESTTSITEQEFDHAVALGLPVYCFVINPDHPWPPKFVEHHRSVELNAFEKKYKTRVCARFTTPDDLAKQVAASLRPLASLPHRPVPTSALKKRLADCIDREIDRSVGRKYIKELYVARRAGNHLRRRLLDHTAPQRMIRSIVSDLATLRISKAAPRPRDRKEVEKVGRLAADLEGLARLAGDLDSAAQGRLLYPCPQVNSLLHNLRNDCVDLQRKLTQTVGHFEQEELLSKIIQQISDARRELRPIDVIIDRAGGGKTNLLCRLAEEIRLEVPTFFVSARSISGVDASAVTTYFRNAYPISDDPVRTAADFAFANGSSAIVIIDAVNEHLDPLKLNLGLQAFIKTYENCAVRFVVSCRDIYWTYFEDAFWLDTSRETIRRQLYSFGKSEFRKALKLYLAAYDIDARPVGDAAEQLMHPLLLRFFCEAFRGTPRRPARVGTVRDIRLLDLFTQYCNMKFVAIQKKLRLHSPDLIFGFVEMLGRMMLKDSKRVVRLQDVISQAKNVLGETEMRGEGTPYVAILDEDIIVEEKPTGPLFDLNVSFVYDEFMEYVIAHCLWKDLHIGNRVRVGDVIRAARQLIQKESQFISVIGIVGYLGGLLSQRQPAEGFKFVDWLLREERYALATSVIERWPRNQSDERLFKRLARVLEEQTTAEVRKRAWQALCQLSQHNWPAFMKNVKATYSHGSLGGAVVFDSVAKLGGGLTPSDRLKSIRWLARLVRFQKTRKAGLGKADRRALWRAVSEIERSSRSYWNSSQKSAARQLLDLIEMKVPREDREGEPRMLTQSG